MKSNLSPLQIWNEKLFKKRDERRQDVLQADRDNKKELKERFMRCSSTMGYPSRSPSWSKTLTGCAAFALLYALVINVLKWLY